jgi:hypothetical protein
VTPTPVTLTALVRATVGLIAGMALTVTLGGCGGGRSAGSYVGDQAVADAASELQAEGAVAYYLGPQAGGLPLTGVERVTENGPDFQFWAAYGRCEVGLFEDGGCMDPLSVATRAWRADTTGFSCQRLEPRLGVPTGVVSGELTLFTGEVLVSVLPMGDSAEAAVGDALSLLPALRPIGADSPAPSLPPPVPDLAAWVDTACGSTPGETIEHPVEGQGAALDNTHVPAFTVDALGGGQLAWVDYRGKPVVVAVGTLDQVLGAVDRLDRLGASSEGRPELIGLVVELGADKGNPRPLADLEHEAGDAVPAPVGYAAIPLPAVWFFDGAANTGQVDDGMDAGVIAFVDASGEVRTYLPIDASDSRLQDAAANLG